MFKQTCVVSSSTDAHANVYNMYTLLQTGPAAMPATEHGREHQQCTGEVCTYIVAHATQLNATQPCW